MINIVMFYVLVIISSTIVLDDWPRGLFLGLAVGNAVVLLVWWLDDRRDARSKS
jgi:hypothetical protein